MHCCWWSELILLWKTNFISKFFHLWWSQHFSHIVLHNHVSWYPPLIFHSSCLVVFFFFSLRQNNYRIIWWLGKKALNCLSPLMEPLQTPLYMGYIYYSIWISEEKGLTARRYLITNTIVSLLDFKPKKRSYLKGIKRNEIFRFFFLGEHCTICLIINLTLVPKISNPLTLSLWLPALVSGIVGELINF